jgi:hypothetical protein
MSSNRHGLSVGIERVDNDYFLSLKAIGQLKHEDYEKLNPMIDSFLEKFDQLKIRVLFDATEFEGWDARAAWDDFQLGLKYGKQFEKIAMYGNKMWQEAAAKIGSWFISGEMKYFDNYDDALKWLRE